MPLRSTTGLPHATDEASPQTTRRAGGRFILSDQIEHRCQTIDITSTAVALRASVRGRVGEHVICYLDQYGRMEGRIARVFDDGFAVDFSAPASKRDRLARQLAWQANRAPGTDAEVRRDERIEPTQKRVVLCLDDNRHIAAQIINLSRSGAALNCPVPLAVGAAVTLGRRAAHVIRATQRLVAVEFVTAIGADEFRNDIIL